MDIALKPGEQIDYLMKDKVPIIQTKDSFSFSLDTILLGYFAKKSIKDNFKIADLCAGNGAASLYLSYFNQAQYDLIEIQAPMADIAKRSIELNELQERVEVHQGDVNDSWQILTKDTYDVVLCNPPYFKIPEGHKINPEEKKAIARHEILINLEQVIEQASGLLKTKGKFYMVHRPERLSEIVLALNKYGLQLRVVQPFIPKVGQDANLIIIQAVKSNNPTGLKIKPDIVVHQENDDYTNEIQEIVNGNN